MDNSRTITIDNYEINPKMLDRAFRKAKQQNKTKDVLSQTFRLLNLYKLYQNNPSDSSIKQAIKIIVDSQFIPNNREENQSRVQFDLSQAFPLNKLGNFGRTLQRKCKLLPKGGIMEFQDEKQQPKFKQIKSFKNRIQTGGDSQNDNKIGWYSDEKNYPFRIILVDKNDGHRGLYFSTKQKAEKIRLVMTQIYNYQGDFSKLMSRVVGKYQIQTHEKFKNKLVARNKMLNVSTRFSRKITFQATKKNEEPPPVEKNEGNTSIYNQSNKRIEGEYQRKITTEMIVLSGLLHTKTNPQTQQSLKQMNRAYLNNMLKLWLQKAKKQELKNRQQSSPQNEIEDSNIMIAKSKINAIDNEKEKKNKFNDLFSKNKLDISNLSVSKGKKELQFGDFAQSTMKDRNKSMKNSVFRDDQSFIKQIDRSFNSDLEEICFYRITFPTLKNLFFKPIVTLELVRRNSVQKSTLFNTIIAKKQPELIYQLLRDKNQDPLTYGSNLKQYEINVKVIDFLSNEQIITDKITLKNKIITQKSIIHSDNKLIELQVGLERPMRETGFQNQDNQDSLNKVQLEIPPLSEAIKDKIHQFWQKQAQSQGYYNQTDMSIYRILSLIQSVPLSWWKDLSEDQYELLHIVNEASKICGFKMSRSFTYITRVFAKIYPDLTILVQKLLSFIQTFLKVYYFPENFNKIQKFHKVLGLDQDCQFISKINLEIQVIKKVVQLQCPVLVDKLERKNINYGYVIMQYIYEAFSRNFTVNILKQLWSFLYKDLQYLQLNMALIIIALIKTYEEDLLKVKRLKQFSRILESKKVNRVTNILNLLETYKEKYFGKAKGFLDEIKNIFNSQPLQPVIYEFYKKQTAKLDKRKKIKFFQKKSSLKKVNRQIDIQFPEYEGKKYTLHILLTKVPEVGGSLSIKCGEIEYECLNHQKKRYFIISEVSSRVYLNFLDLKSNQFSCQLIFSQGIHQNSCFLTSSKVTGSHKITYIAGLLTDNQIEILKKGRKYEHFVSPFVRSIQMLQQMNRPISQTYFLRKYDNHSSKDDLIKKIKTLFCSGNKVFNEIEFYIEQIETSELTIEQKIYFTRMLAKQFSEESSLCNNHIYEKHFLRQFLESTGYEITPQQYECYYGDSFQYEFDSPKILKCRFFPIHQSNKELKLQLPALDYFVNKSVTHMYSDIVIDDLVQAITPVINQQLQGLYEGELKLFYSSGGQIFMKSWNLKFKNKNKQYTSQEILQDNARQIQETQLEQPQLLMSQILPSFAKISTILDYVNNNRNVDLKSKYQDKDRKKIAQQINLLKESQNKFKRVIMMRYHQPPQKLYFPFFSYYYELTHDFSTPHLKNMFLNNLKTDLKALCLFRGTLKYGENSKMQSYNYKPQVGLYGNLRMISKDAKGWFFFGLVKDQNEDRKNNARIFVNYGYGVFRWQNCQVLGYVLRNKEVKTQKSTAQHKLKKQYFVRVRNQQKYVKDYELEMSPQTLSKLQKINEGSDKPLRYQRSNYEDNQQQKKSSQLKYLSKFMK